MLLEMAIEIMDLPIDSMVIFHSYVSLPEVLRLRLLDHVDQTALKIVGWQEI